MTRWCGALALLITFGLAFGLHASENRWKPVNSPFVKTAGTTFTLNGKPFYITGANNHYLTSGTDAEVIGVLDDAVAMGANVIRTYLQPVIGSLDGEMASVPTIWDWENKAESSALGVNGNYLLYWDAANKRMGFNDGPNGIERVDFLVAEAKKRNIKLIVAFLDFWAWTGGAQQMRAWYGSTDKHGFFFSDPRTKRDYKAWIEHVVSRLNPKTGLRYRDEPTIMAWELMNEGNAEPMQLRQDWTAEMTAYVKSVDSNHLVASGHANAKYQVFDITNDLAIPTVDFGTWHGYPRFFNVSPQVIDQLIPKYCGLAAVYNKPVLLEEFGWARSHPDYVAVYRKWLDTVNHDRNCAGWLVWRLVSRQQSGNFPADEYDQFDIRNDGSALWNVFKNAAAQAHHTRSVMR